MALHENLVRTLVGGQTFERGEAYYQQGAVQHPSRRGNLFLADVEGSQFQPYQVRITLADGTIAAAQCTCPQTGYCKHIAAVLIAYVRQPELFTTRAEPDSLLRDLSAEQLKTLWENLIAQKPELADWLETAVTWKQPLPG
jgi:uncharacterized Zn finger protein